MASVLEIFLAEESSSIRGDKPRRANNKLDSTQKNITQFQ